MVSHADRLLRRSYAAMKLESADPALRPLFEDLAARLMQDDAKTRAMRVKVLRKVMEADFSTLGIVDAWLGDDTGTHRGGGVVRIKVGEEEQKAVRSD